MSEVFQEWCDRNQHRSFPLIDSAYGKDITDAFTLPTSLITDIFLCAPNLALVDKNKFYVRNVVIRRYFIDITLGYEGVDDVLGIFKNIRVDAALQTSYDFTPSEIQSNDEYAPLFFMTGQITIGSCTDAITSLGSWTFLPAQTYLSPARISQGVLNVQYISINDRLFTGVVKLKEGANVTMDVEQQVVGGEIVTYITFSASLSADATLQLVNDESVLNALIAQFGTPIRTINGILPDANRNFLVSGVDCTNLEDLDHGIAIANPCANPCCDEDENIRDILGDIANLNLRYAQLKSYFESQAYAVNNLQNKLLVLGNEI